MADFLNTTSTINARLSRADARQSARRIMYGVCEFAVGHMTVAVTDEMVCAISFISAHKRQKKHEGQEKRETEADDSLFLKTLKNTWPMADIIRHDEMIQLYVKNIEKEKSSTTPIPLLVVGTEFQVEVWKKLQEIPHGKTRTYADIAQEVGNPTAVRAVGTACGKNKIALLIPCHRVCSSNGTLGGYRWGLDKKKKILALEQV